MIISWDGKKKLKSTLFFLIITKKVFMLSQKKIKLGYSCWGFLGQGIKDTPDGGRCHRFTFLKEIISHNVDIILLQKNRDLLEANEEIQHKGLGFSNKYPDIDILFLEYRWKIPGRNCEVKKKSSNYTPDYDRQSDLIKYYSERKVPIFIWDKDE